MGAVGRLLETDDIKLMSRLGLVFLGAWDSVCAWKYYSLLKEYGESEIKHFARVRCEQMTNKKITQC